MVLGARPALPLAFDQSYAEVRCGRRLVRGRGGVTSGGGDVSDDVKMLQDEVHRLRLELTSKEQDIQESRGQKK